MQIKSKQKYQCIKIFKTGFALLDLFKYVKSDLRLTLD